MTKRIIDAEFEVISGPAKRERRERWLSYTVRTSRPERGQPVISNWFALIYMLIMAPITFIVGQVLSAIFLHRH